MFNPSILTFAVNDIPLLCSTILSWLRPPYLYVIINIIIITIIATSRFPPVTVPPMTVYEDVNMLSKMYTVLYVVENPIIYDEPVVVDDKEVLVVNEAEDIHEVTRSTWQSPVEKVQMEFVFPVREKPLASSRFSGQRKLTTKVNPEVAYGRLMKFMGPVPLLHSRLSNTKLMLCVANK
nr:hypothetical protein [Tanacetum cinerariifolium]